MTSDETRLLVRPTTNKVCQQPTMSRASRAAPERYGVDWTPSYHVLLVHAAN